MQGASPDQFRRLTAICSLALVIGLALSLVSVGSASALSVARPPSSELVVTLRPGFHPSSLDTRAGSGFRGWEALASDGRVASFRYRDRASAAAGLRQLRASPAVVVAEPAATRRLAWSPGDAQFAEQAWWLDQINAEPAWQATTGSADVVVAVIDSGVSPTHPDLIDRLVPGYNAIDGSANSADVDGHGTHVAGIIAAQGANQVGTAGVAMDVRVMPIRVVDDAGEIDVADEIEAIYWAVDNGADVINLSLGSDDFVAAERDAIRYAVERGVVVVASAGNELGAISYPAQYDEVISVGSLQQDGNPSLFTSRLTRVDLAAPGEHIFSPGWDSFYGDYWDDVFYADYTAVSGTSFATAMVSGAAALLRSVARDASPETLRAWLTTTAADSGDPGPQAGAGAGELDVEHAVRTAISGAIDRTWQRSDGPLVTGDTARTWLWGDGAPVYAYEDYADAARGTRLVVYFDKARMEVTDPLKPRDDGWYVTNGLLVSELITGRMQLGDADFVQLAPAEVNVAGDGDDALGPTYASFARLLTMPAGLEGSPTILTIDRDGRVNADSALATYGVYGDEYVAETKHRVASVFWNYLNSIGIVANADGSRAVGALFDPWFYATGYPITEPFWSRVKLRGAYVDVLIQCFERRCLTYTPSNALGWQVEMGNVGRHYHAWRYGTSTPSADTSADADTRTLAREARRGGPSRLRFIQ